MSIAFTSCCVLLSFSIWSALLLMRALFVLLTPKVSGWSSPSPFLHSDTTAQMVVQSHFLISLTSSVQWWSVAPGCWQCIWALKIPARSHYNIHIWNPITKERRDGMWTAGLPYTPHLKHCCWLAWMIDWLLFNQWPHKLNRVSGDCQ